VGRNPETSEATAPQCAKARKLDLAPCSADLIEASGHIVPRAKAGHMTAPSQCVKSTQKALASRAVPHMGQGQEFSRYEADGNSVVDTGRVETVKYKTWLVHYSQFTAGITSLR